MVLLNYYKLHPEAKAPYKAHEYDACYDIYACLKGVDSVKTSFTCYPQSNILNKIEPQEIKDVIRVQKSEDCVLLPPHSSTIIPTGIVYGIPAGYRLDVRARSGRAAKYRQSLTNSVGTIDAGYNDQIYVMVTNGSGEVHRINHLDKIAQIHLEKVIPIELCEVKEANRVQPITLLRNGGLGSTGDN